MKRGKNSCFSRNLWNDLRHPTGAQLRFHDRGAGEGISLEWRKMELQRNDVKERRNHKKEKGYHEPTQEENG